MYKCILVASVSMFAGLAAAYSQDQSLISLLKVKTISAWMNYGGLGIDVQVTQPIANVSISSAGWLFGFALIGFALFVNRRKV